MWYIFSVYSTPEMTGLRTVTSGLTYLLHSFVDKPAFRDMIEAWSSVKIDEVKNLTDTVSIDWDSLTVELEVVLRNFSTSGGVDTSSLQEELIDLIDRKSTPHELEVYGRKASSDERLNFARNIFGEFIPDLNYHSVSDIQETILADINKFNMENNYTEPDLAPSLQIIFQPYLDGVSKFLEQKDLVIHWSEAFSSMGFLGGRIWENVLPLKIKLKEADIYRELDSLSSGERQIVTMLYAASNMSDQKVLLIDEPEISLHVDWQEKLLKEMFEQERNRQIIVCTHSHMIGVNYEDKMLEIKLTTTQPK